MHSVLWTLLVIAVPVSAAFGGEWGEVRWKPREVQQGEALYVEVQTKTRISLIEGDLDGSPILFYEREGGGRAGIAGVDLAASPGLHPLRVRVQDLKGRPSKVMFQVKVKKGQFVVQRLTLPREKVELKGKILKRVLRENKKVKAVLGKARPKKFWHSPFIRPVDGSITGAFGLRRILNNRPRSPHSGVDIGAPLGTKVSSCNDGIVVFAQELYLGGNTVIIDHGLGLYSMYMHLAEIWVKDGAQLRVGDIIGLVGATGRVTGPHLHWGVRLMGARIDPFSLLRLFAPGE